MALVGVAPRLTRLSPPSGAPRLLCLPHAGGRGDAYRRWVADADGALELWTTDLPGRHTRAHEPLVADPDAVVAELAARASALLDRPLAVFGHSMGALLGFELVRALEDAGCAPAALFVSACPAPGTRTREEPHETDAQLVALLRRWGGTPEELLAEPEFLDVALPPLRADLALLERYVPPAGGVRAPLTAFAAVEDTVAPPESMRAWATRSTRWRGLRIVPGGHFFLHASWEAVLDGVVAGLAAG